MRAILFSQASVFNVHFILTFSRREKGKDFFSNLLKDKGIRGGVVVPQPEQEARKATDRLLEQAGWTVCDADKANIYAARGRGGSAGHPVNVRPTERAAREWQPCTFSRSAECTAKKAIREFPLSDTTLLITFLATTPQIYRERNWARFSAPRSGERHRWCESSSSTVFNEGE